MDPTPISTYAFVFSMSWFCCPGIILLSRALGIPLLLFTVAFVGEAKLVVDEDVGEDGNWLTLFFLLVLLHCLKL